MTAREDIVRWIREAPKGTTHVIVATDTFDWEDYPVYVVNGEAAATVARITTSGSMAKVIEVYDLALPIEPQLSEFRAWHL